MLRSMKQPCVYLLASHYYDTLYIGVISDLVERTWQQRNGAIEGFTKRYRVHDLAGTSCTATCMPQSHGKSQ
jgi:putative endonuclease